MRQALVNENNDLVAQNPKYIMRITGDNAEGKAQLDNFIAEDSTYPVIVTTSKLMTTGVDCKTCRLIVLDNNINSMTEFKQIIGRGTRLKPDYGKEYFTIMDFRNACRLFADPDFDGDPISVIDDPIDDPDKPPVEPDVPLTPPTIPSGDEGNDPPEKRHKFRVRGVEVRVLNERVQYYDKDGKLITESVTDYSKKTFSENMPLWILSYVHGTVSSESKPLLMNCRNMVYYLKRCGRLPVKKILTILT